MSRILLIMALILLLVATSFTLSGCGIKYCEVSGCPSECSLHSNYCYEHKCANLNCNNEGMGSYTYCEECIERAQENQQH